MRNIFFKFWSKEQRRWVPWFFERMGFISESHSEERAADGYPVTGKMIINIPADFELCQFTGLQDYIGRDIYEGDICNRYSYEREAYIVSVVEFQNGAFVLVSNEDVTCNLWDIPSSRISVIGNYFENPELLTIKSES